MFLQKCISLLLIFVLIISACKKSSEQSQHSENNDTNKNIIEKTSEVPNTEETQVESFSENLIDAIELKLQFQDKLNNLIIESEEDFLSDEEIAELSPGNISQYINALFKNDKLHQEAIYHILKSGIINSANINDIKRIYNKINFWIYDKDKNKENIIMLYNHAKNIGNTELQNILYGKVLDIIKYTENPYNSRVLCLQLSEWYQDDPEKKQEIEFNFYKKNKKETPYEKIEKNFDNFLKNANQNYGSYDEAIEFFSQQKTIDQVLKTLNDEQFKRIKLEKYMIDAKYLDNLKNAKEKDEYTLNRIEYLETYHALYSNIYQQIKETYQK